MPQISVIVPVYKVEPYLRRCVDSILAQTFTDFELILVDDGSPDNCGAICDEYAEQDARIHVIHQPNGGLSAARNAGIDWAFANSDSKWLSFIDSDDWIHPQYFAFLYRAVRESGLTISCCHFQRTAEQENYMADVTFRMRILDGLEFFVSEENTTATVAWAKLYDKSLFRDTRYPVGKIHEDEFVTYRLLAKAGRVAVLENRLYYYYINANGIVLGKYSLKRLDAMNAFEQQRIFFQTTDNKQLYKQWVFRHLFVYCVHVQLLEEIGEYKERNRIRRTARYLFFSNLNVVRQLDWKRKQTIIEACFPLLRHILIPGKIFTDIARREGVVAAFRCYWKKIQYKKVD